nr:unnamed protein product [Callosobruchus chinensis]
MWWTEEVQLPCMLVQSLQKRSH